MYRAAKDDDRDAIRRVLRICFGLSELRAGLSIDRAGLHEIRVYGDVEATTYLIPMGIFLGGRTISNLGIAAVGVLPEHRGKNLSMTMMQAVLREGRDRGFAVSTLHPATETVYRKVGYELFGGYWEIRMPIATIGTAERGPTIRRYGPDDREAVRALYGRHARGFEGHLDRGEYVWQGIHAVRERPADGYVVLEGGELTGYCFLVQDTLPNAKYELRATDVVAMTRPAARRLLTFFADHRSLGTDVTWHGGPLDALIAEVPEHRYALSLRHFIMMRVLDAKRAFEARGYPRHVRAKLEIAIADPLLDEHAGTWVLDVANGCAELTRGGRGSLEMGACGLAALFGQYQPVHRLAALGLIHGDAEALDTASSIFTGPQPSVTDMF
jgi:predicted acetyltransferase